MLGVKTYPAAYIQASRERLDTLLGALAAVTKDRPSAEHQRFEGLLFRELLVVLDGCFVHRLRGVEGKDGNVMNEVRMLAASVLEPGGRLREMPGIKYRAETSVAGVAIGQPIDLDRAAFERLAARFFAAITATFGEKG